MFRVTLLVCASILTAALCLAEPPHREAVRIGIIVPLTGALAEAGAAFRDAARMAIDEIPASSRFEYQLLVEDDGLLPMKVAGAAQKLLTQDRVDALVSTWSYGGTVVAPLAERAKVLHFGVAWDPAVAKGLFNFIHLAPPARFLPVFLEIFERLGYGRIAAIGMIESGSVFCLDELERAVKGTSFRITDRVTLNYNELDFRSVIARLEAKQPDVYFTNFGTVQNDIFMKQAAEMRVKAPITSITGFDVAEDLTYLEGRWYVSDSIMPDDFAERFESKYHHGRLYGVGNFYDVVKLIVDRYENSGKNRKPRPGELLPRFKNLSDFSSAFGALSIDEEGIIAYPVQCREIRGGRRLTVPCSRIK